MDIIKMTPEHKI